MTISKDEREARDWLAMIIRSHSTYQREPEIARTILAPLDRPVMPAPDEVPDDVWDQCVYAERMAGKDPYLRAQAAYRALYDHYHQPPVPPSVKDAALALNAAVDAMWNAGPRDTDNHVKAVCAAQQELKRAVEADHD